jgi:hypothetical protein
MAQITTKGRQAFTLAAKLGGFGRMAFWQGDE